MPERATVLDLGCGDCLLPSERVKRKNIRGTGVGINGSLLAQLGLFVIARK